MNEQQQRKSAERVAMELALEALEGLVRLAEHEGWEGFYKQYNAITAIKEALMSQSDGAQPEQEPSYWLGYGLQAHTEKPFEGATPVWTKPPQRKPLTDEQIEEIAARTLFPVNFARAIEAAHGIKE